MTGAAPLRAVLVHGNAGSGAVWGRVVAALGDGARAAVVDLPGFGAARAESPAGDGRLASFVEPVVAAARALGGPVVLAGNGIGSVLCGHAALALGADCAGVVMTGPVGVPGGHTRFRALSRSRWGAVFLRYAGISAFGRDRFLHDQMARPRDDVEGSKILGAALLDAWAFHLLARLNRPESLDGLGALTCPVTVLWGEHDGVLPVAEAPALLARLPGHARLVRVPGAGHALPLERAALVAEHVRSVAARA